MLKRTTNKAEVWRSFVRGRADAMVYQGLCKLGMFTAFGSNSLDMRFGFVA